MDLSGYRASTREQHRTSDLLALMPASGGTALDIGARDGHFSLLLAQRFDQVIALDLTLPAISHPNVMCVQGNVGKLDLPDRSVDLVFCAEVLEHVPSILLGAACQELQRVCRGQLLIGVPYRQDIRAGRTTCYTCGGKNPPWGHVNRFDEHRLAQLFAGFTIEAVHYVGHSTEQTNALAAQLMDLAGNPYGTYQQEEPCVHCGASLVAPPARSPGQKVLTRFAFLAQAATGLFTRPHGNWIHMLFAIKDKNHA